MRVDGFVNTFCAAPIANATDSQVKREVLLTLTAEGRLVGHGLATNITGGRVAIAD